MGVGGVSVRRAQSHMSRNKDERVVTGHVCTQNRHTVLPVRTYEIIILFADILLHTI